MMNTIAESVLEMSDQQILSEAEEVFDQAYVAADRVREVLQSSVKAYRQRHLFEALEEYHREVAQLREKRFEFPSTPEGKRQLLGSVFQRFPQMQNTFLTVQHRDFKSLSDEDIESFLTQLKLLGAFGHGEN